MQKFAVQGMFGSTLLNTIEEARAVLNFAFEQHQKKEERVHKIQCRVMFDNGYVPISVPFDTQTIPPADEYAVFNMYSGKYVVYKTFDEAKSVVETQHKKRTEELQSSYSISTCSMDLETGEESWVVIETLGGANE